MALRTILTILEKPVMNLFTVRPLGKGKYFTFILLKGVVWTFTAVHAVHTTYARHYKPRFVYILSTF